MINLYKLTEKEKNLLRKMVLCVCEGCHEEEEKVGKLEIHRIRINHQGGIYHLRNIKILCTSCHRKYHQNEHNHIQPTP